ncbi:zinc-finger of the MIZ type in Nse subunit-domain-containing protein [Amylocystis lapponica]|nr:zinc-finger of the MIZ type in Nse subunit-domain-containing protein [Amylocystis lapponica]
MPAAGPSRRKTAARRRDPSEDRIEEDEPTQGRGQDEVDDDDEDDDDDDDGPNARPAENGVKKEKKAPVVEDPLKDFGDQPLDRALGAKIAGIASDWSLMRNITHGPSYAIVRDVAVSLAEFTDGEKGQKALLDVDNMMRELLDTDNELQVHENALNEINQKIAQKEEINDVVDRYQKEVQCKLDAYSKKTTRQKYAKSDDYVTFKQAIFEVQNPDTAMPPVTDFIPKEDGDDSDDDDDVQIGGVTQDYKCPLTLTILVDPVTSTICGHSFSQDSIKEFLGPNRATKKECPAAGCHKQISLSDLKPNKELAKKAKDAARRERAREEDSDAEEVIE